LLWWVSIVHGVCTHIDPPPSAVVVLLQDALERARVANPLEEATVLIERHDGVCAHIKVAATTFRRRVEELVDHRVEVHQARVFAQVVVRLAQERVSLAVRTLEHELLGLLERRHDLDLVYNVCHELVAVHWATQVTHQGSGPERSETPGGP
jgi:phage tail sheath protein FI